MQTSLAVTQDYGRGFATGSRWLDVALVTLAALAWFATPLRSLRLVTDWYEPIRVTLSLAVAVLGGVAAIQLARRLPTLLPMLRAQLMRYPLWAFVALGLALRLAWIVAFPATPGSDGGTYLSLAKKLATGGAFEVAQTRAYWPPGYPIFLSVWMTVFGTSKIVWLCTNLMLYIVAVYGIDRLVRQLANPAAARLAVLLFALWPNLVAHSATPEKETLVIALLPWTTWIVVRLMQGKGSSGSIIAAGLLLGLAILVQPSLQLLVPALSMALFLILRPAYRAIAPTLALIVGVAMVVAPWTLRNYHEFGQLVLVSTNGGSNLYRANNPLATGGYTNRGEVSLSGLSELESDKEGKRLAIEWIRSHPADFAKLAVEKQIRFMGDDSGGVYSTLKVGKASDSPPLFAIIKGFSNAWWLAMWLLLAAAVISMRNTKSDVSPLSRFPAWFWLYLFALPSVFESSGKYHVPVLWALPVLISIYLLGRSGITPETR